VLLRDTDSFDSLNPHFIIFTYAMVRIILKNTLLRAVKMPVVSAVLVKRNSWVTHAWQTHASSLRNAPSPNFLLHLLSSNTCAHSTPFSRWNFLSLLPWRLLRSAADLMEPSPLIQQSRPESFQPKIVWLYEALFRVRLSRCYFKIQG